VNLRNNDRAPLLLMAGGADHTVPVALVQEARKRHYKSTAVTDYKEFPGQV
jgi:predicted esterase